MLLLSNIMINQLKEIGEFALRSRDINAELTLANYDNIVQEAEKYVEEDKKKKEAAEFRNKGDNLVYTTEKSLKDFGDKISDSDKKNIEDKVGALKEMLKQSNPAAEQIQKAMDELTQASYKLAEEVYKSSTQQQAQGQQAGPSQSGSSEADTQKEQPSQQGPKEGEVIDAEYKEEDQKK